MLTPLRHQICINESSQEIVLVDDAGCLHVWSCSQEKIIKTETVCAGPLVAAMLGSSPNDVLAVGTNAVHLFHTYRGSLQRAYSGHSENVISIITHPDPDEPKLFTASQDNRYGNNFLRSKHALTRRRQHHRVEHRRHERAQHVQGVEKRNILHDLRRRRVQLVGLLVCCVARACLSALRNL
jgi:hypothetical protein